MRRGTIPSRTSAPRRRCSLPTPPMRAVTGTPPPRASAGSTWPPGVSRTSPPSRRHKASRDRRRQPPRARLQTRPVRPRPIFHPSSGGRRPTSTGVPHIVIIHTCESNYASCWSWLDNPASQVSAHYVVNEDGSEISQLVREPNRAWHIAALYDCTLNRRHECWRNGVQSNHFTVGIEHAGFASQDSFPRAQLDRSAALVCDITRDRAIPRDWQHIVGHGQLQPADRTDP